MKSVCDRARRSFAASGVLLSLVAFSACGSAADPSGGSAAAVSVGPSPSTTAAAPAESTATSPTPTEDPFLLVALGDSIPFNSPDDCPGCVGFVTSYGRALESELGRPVQVQNLSRHDGAQTQDIVNELGQDGALVQALSNADAVIVSIGFNDLPPYGVAPEGCPAPPSESDPATVWAEALAATSEDCIDAVTPKTAEQARQVLERIRELAPDAPVGALTAFDWWSGWTDLDAMDPATVGRLHDAIRHALVKWNAALCAEVDAVDGVCVDTYLAFNGPDGDVASGDLLAPDYSHPSQKGNDIIRDVLIESDLVPAG